MLWSGKIALKLSPVAHISFFRVIIRLSPKHVSKAGMKQCGMYQCHVVSPNYVTGAVWAQPPLDSGR